MQPRRLTLRWTSNLAWLNKPSVSVTSWASGSHRFPPTSQATPSACEYRQTHTAMQTLWMGDVLDCWGSSCFKSQINCLETFSTCADQENNSSNTFGPFFPSPLFLMELSHFVYCRNIIGLEKNFLKERTKYPDLKSLISVRLPKHWVNKCLSLHVQQSLCLS